MSRVEEAGGAGDGGGGACGGVAKDGEGGGGGDSEDPSNAKSLVGKGAKTSRPVSWISNVSDTSKLSEATTVTEASLEEHLKEEEEEEEEEEEKEEEMEGDDIEDGEEEVEEVKKRSTPPPPSDDYVDRIAISSLLGINPSTSSASSSSAVDEVFRLLGSLKDTLKESQNINAETPPLLKELGPPPPPPPPPKDYTLTMSTEIGDRQGVDVFIRVGFLKMGEIQTAKEKYVCDVYVSAKWREPALDELTLRDIQDGVPKEFFADLWNPQLFLENAHGAPKVKQWYEVWTSPQGQRFVHENRIVHTVWSETLELWDFPFDTQDLSVTVGSGRRIPEVHLKPDPLPSAVVKGHFMDEQEWYLHDHVEVSTNTINHWYTHPPLAQPFITFTTRVSRRLGYYYWHAYFCLLLIIFMTFTSFAVRSNPPDYRPYPPESGNERRLRLSYLLMLTSVSYKFYIGENLPRVSYFTRLDYYIFFSILFNGLVSVWHGVIFWFEFCNKEVMYQHFFHIGARPPEGLAPGRTNAENCNYPFTLTQERVFIGICFIVVFLYNVYYFLAAHINVRCRYRQMLKEDQMYNLKIAELVRTGKIQSRMDIFKFPENNL